MTIWTSLVGNTFITEDNQLIYTDLNVRLPIVNSDSITIANSKAIVQSISRLLKTREGEIPYYRNYGLNLKQFVQKPLTRVTAQAIYDHVRNKIIEYEQRVNIIGAQTEADYDRGIITMVFTLQIKATGEVIQTDVLRVPVAV